MDRIRIVRLRAYMRNLPAGQISVGVKKHVEQLLFESWNDLQINSRDSRVEPYGLINRTGTLTWQPPCLTFQIESYEATISVSIDTKVREWTVNLETAQAVIGRTIPEEKHNRV